jgi:hypothetical protein
MSFKDKLSEEIKNKWPSRSERFILGLSLVPILILGTLTYFSLFSPPPQDISHLETANRFLASESEPSEPKNEFENVSSEGLNNENSVLDSSSSLIDLKCIEDQNNIELKSSEKSLQFMWRDCQKKQFSNITLMNRTNGTSATVFKILDNLFQTDFIFMAKGKNQFILTAENESGERIVSQFVIENTFTQSN